MTGLRFAWSKSCGTKLRLLRPWLSESIESTRTSRDLSSGAQQKRADGGGAAAISPDAATGASVIDADVRLAVGIYRRYCLQPIGYSPIPFRERSTITCEPILRFDPTSVLESPQAPPCRCFAQCDGFADFCNRRDPAVVTFGNDPADDTGLRVTQHRGTNLSAVAADADPVALRELLHQHILNVDLVMRRTHVGPRANQYRTDLVGGTIQLKPIGTIAGPTAAAITSTLREARL